MFISKIPLRGPPPPKHIKKDGTHSVHGCKVGIFSVKIKTFWHFLRILGFFVNKNEIKVKKCHDSGHLALFQASLFTGWHFLAQTLAKKNF